MEVRQYVNSPADGRSNRQEHRDMCGSGRSKIFCLVGISFVLLCLIQLALNLFILPQTAECSNRSDDFPTCNFTTMSGVIRDLILERDQLLQEKNKLNQDKNKLKQEKDQLLQENNNLKQEKVLLLQEEDRLRREKNQLIQEKNKLNQDKNKLKQEKDQLIQEKNNLNLEKDQLIQEKNKLNQDKNNLKKEKNQLIEENNNLNLEKNQLIQEKNKLNRDKNNLNQEKNQLIQEKNKLNQDKNNLKQEKDQLIQEKNKLNQVNNNLKQEKDQLLQDNHQLQQEKDQLLQSQGPNSKSCPQGWFPYRCTCYQVSSSKNSWDYANRDCKRKGAHLVTFSNKEEETFLRNVGGAFNVWMGLRGDRLSYQWTWTLVDGGTLHYTNWNPHPDRSNNRYVPSVCVYFTTDLSISKTWFWSTCEVWRYWMCEM
uniref:oxidized low-density lipoprotein receptor 1-like isoform X3 n=1 Tax=Scatophagus argus TaxID=75038 RepID=UPI001ED7D16F|nr:oxidized low-density lipoprotein receptor 1-like isoform X3 [Scatophagus argus]